MTVTEIGFCCLERPARTENVVFLTEHRASPSAFPLSNGSRAKV